MKRTTEFVLGLLGGLFGFGGAFFAFFFGAVDHAVSGSNDISSLSVGAFIASILGIIGSVWVKFNAKVGGAIMLVAGIIGIISIFVFYLLPGLLLVIAGIMGIFRKEKPTVEAQA